MKSKLVEFNIERAVETVTPKTCLMICGNYFHYTKNQRSREPKIEDQGNQRSKIKGTKDRGGEGSREQRKIFESSDVMNSTSLEKT